MKQVKSHLNRVPKITKGTSNPTANFPVEYYSYSSFVKFSTNPILFKIQYINKDRFDTTTGVTGILGRSFHKALEVYDGGNPDLLPKDEAEAIEFGLKTGMDFLSKYEEGFIEYSDKVATKQKALDYLSFAFAAYVKERKRNPDEKILGSEVEISETIDIEWRGHKLTLPIPLKGYLDKVVRVDGKLKIVDYKTCFSFSDPEKIDGKKIIQAVQYYLLAYAKYGEEPYSTIFEETKLSKNQDGSPQTRQYEVIYAKNELYFDFYFRLYEDVTNALNGQMVFVPNVDTFYDNEVAMIAYIHRLDVDEKKAAMMKKLKVTNITDLLKKKIQSAGSMRQMMKTVEKKFVSAKNLNYENMKNEQKIQMKLMEHGMMLTFDSKIEGATVDLYQFVPSIGLKMSRIASFVSDVEQVMGTSGIRVLAPIPNSTMVGFEVPKKNRKFPKLPKNKDFNLAIGETIMGEVRRFDVRTAPHMLVAGSSGSGKSVFLGSIITQLSVLTNVDLHLFDPKQVELSQFEAFAHEYKDDPMEINDSLGILVEEMNERYSAMKAKGVKNISEMGGRYKFVIIDEFADLAMSTGIMKNFQLLAQKGRACGIHLIIATQRASTQIVKGDVKVNFPTKVVFRMAKEIDSRVMIDEPGAEKLVGKGDMLFVSETGVERLQGFSI